MNEAIKLAIEGGWRDDGSVKIVNGDIYTFGARIVDSEVILDPLFWQALSKALGFGLEVRSCTCNGYSSQCTCDFYWQRIADDYFYEVMHEGDLEKFWKELIKHE